MGEDGSEVDEFVEQMKHVLAEGALAAGRFDLARPAADDQCPGGDRLDELDAMAIEQDADLAADGRQRSPLDLDEAALHDGIDAVTGDGHFAVLG